MNLLQYRRTNGRNPKYYKMTKFALLGAAALACVAAATPVKAQEVIYNPGYCAQFYPNANCQNKGANNPYTGDYQRRLEMRNALVLGASPCTMGVKFYVSRSGRRVYCY